MLISDLIQDAHVKKEYRPVVVAIIKNSKDEVLVVQSAKNPDEWYLPQGGIKENEMLEYALFREIREELGLTQSDMAEMRYVGCEDMDAESTRKDKRGFSRGKRYFFCTVAYQGNGQTLKLNKEEISRYLWVAIADMAYIFMPSRMEKRELMLRWLAKL